MPRQAVHNDLFQQWLDFSHNYLNNEWWAVKPEADPESHTAEGVELRRLQKATSELLSSLAERHNMTDSRFDATTERLISNIPVVCKVLEDQGHHNLAGQLRRDSDNLVYWRKHGLISALCDNIRTLADYADGLEDALELCPDWPTEDWDEGVKK